jgi:hypothetical protein
MVAGNADLLSKRNPVLCPVVRLLLVNRICVQSTGILRILRASAGSTAVPPLTL